MSKERYVNLSDRQVKDTQNQSQDFMSINTICRRLNQQDKTIADLEAKLAESELKIKGLKETNKILSNELTKDSILKQDHLETCCGIPIHEIPKLKQQLLDTEFRYGNLHNLYYKDTEELKQQLAEKDKEIKGLTTDLQEALTLIKEGRELADLNNKVLEKQHQDKISFCIEQLSYFKVLRGLVLNMRMSGFEEFRDKIPMKYLAMADAHMEKLADIVDDQVNNQIKRLKEMK